MNGLPHGNHSAMKRLTAYRRQLMREVMNGDARLGRVLFYWNSKESAEVESVLRYLVRIGATGKKLADWIFKVYGPTEDGFEWAYQHTLSKANRQPTARSILISR